MGNTILINDSVKIMSEYLGEYQLLTTCISEDMDFKDSFELTRKVKSLDYKTLLLVRKIDPIYESIIINNFYQIDPNNLTTILHRISMLESIINDLNQTIVNYQIN
jgi:hypothetical protein